MSRTNMGILYLVSFLYIFLVYLLVNHKEAYFLFDTEFGISESFGALMLLATSITLFLVAKKYKNQKSNFQYLFAFFGALFFWAAGEEISWGQHFLGTVTPEWLAKINDQGETNLHNINKKFFDRLVDRVPLLLVAVSSVMIIKGKKTLLNISTLDFPLCLAFILMVVYRKHQVIETDFWNLYYIFLLPLFFISLKRKNINALFMCTLTAVSAFIVVFYHNKYQHLFGPNENVYHEIREMVFSTLCFFYALLIFKSVKLNSLL